MQEVGALWAELAALDQRRQDYDRRIREAVNRQRYIAEARSNEAARAEERRLMIELDRVMTRIRAVEGKLLLARRSASGQGEQSSFVATFSKPN
jgi:hypothetical protein